MKQRDIDIAFSSKMSNGGGYEVREYWEDIVQIQTTVYSVFKVLLSASEAIYFWHWRSDQYDASWLMVSSDKDISEWFLKFIRDWYGKCEKCNDAGWVWWNELDEYDGPGVETGQNDTKYTCDECEGRFAEYE